MKPERSTTTLRPWGERMPTFPVPQGRRSTRVTSKKRASLVINLDRNPKRFPCLVLDSSKEGFRLRGSFELRRGQVVELILDENMPSPERCRVDRKSTRLNSSHGYISYA